MAKAVWPVPRVFNPEGETIKLLAKTKAKLWKSFKWSKAQSLYDAGALAVLLHVFGRDDETLAICRELGRIQFNGTYSLWSGVETALTLQSRLLRQQGETEEAEACVQRVRDAGYAEARLEGNLLDRNDSVKEATKTGDTKWELGARFVQAKEIAFIIELGGSTKCPIEQMEQEWATNYTRLRE
jgi:hypothetical protein